MTWSGPTELGTKMHPVIDYGFNIFFVLYIAIAKSLYFKQFFTDSYVVSIAV